MEAPVSEREGTANDIIAPVRAAAREGRLAHAFARARRARIEARFDPPLRAALAFELAWLGFQLGRSERGVHFATEAIELAGGLDDRRLLIRSMALRAWLLLEIGRGVNAAEEAVRAREWSDAHGDREAASWALNVLGCVYWYSRHLERAEECCRRAVELAQAGNDPVVLGWWLINLAGVHDQRGRDEREAGNMGLATLHTDRGRALAAEAIGLLEDAGDAWGLSLIILNMVDDLLSTAETGAARAWMDRLDALPPVDGDRSRTQTLLLRGRLLLGSDQPAEALPILLESLVASERCANHDGLLFALDSAASACERLGRFAEACVMLRRRQNLAPQVIAERVQERGRLSEILLGLRHLEREVEMAERRFEAAMTEARRLAEDIRRDPLTGIGNRRRFEEALAALLSSEPYAVAMVDIDHFKSINDRFSHMVGDEVLRAVAETLAAVIRQGDLVTRFGGEEFAILLYDVDAAQGARMCRRLRRAIMERSYGPRLHPIRVTASFGIADSTEAPQSLGVLARADQRLYLAKRLGRNRVVAKALPVTQRRRSLIEPALVPA